MIFGIFDAMDSHKITDKNKAVLAGMTLSQLTETALQAGLPEYAGKQLANWLYKKYINDFNLMTNLPAKARAWLMQHYETGWKPHIKHQESEDGTVKYLYKTQNNGFIESVWIPEGNRSTLCVSSQVGCRMGCRFCSTAKQGFQDQLTSGEIINQIVSLPQRDKLTNVVYMGMGEPFDNLENVMNSLEILTSGYGFGWSYQRITVSTIGIIPGMIHFLEKSQCHLAVSLHSPFDAQRQEMIPMQKLYPVSEVIKTIKKYDFQHQRRVSFEYILFDGINDTQEHALEIVRLTQGLPCRINLIAFHPFPGCIYKSPELLKMEQFRDFLNKKGMVCTIRKSRGADISAACGLLSTKEMNAKKTGQ